jgi:polysaccharide pyruvyl transferase WcaK-like protein
MPAARVAILGTFDVDNYGDHLFPRVATHELARRLPDVVVEPFSPYGRLHPTRLDGGRAAAPLGPWSAERAAELAAGHDLVLVGGGELLHLNDPLLAPVYDTTPDELARMAPSRWFVEGLGPVLEARCPVVWHGVGVPWAPDDEGAARLRAALADRPYVTVRDRYSAERLAKAGVDRPVDVVPDSALLLDRIMPEELLRERLAALRAKGCYPPAGSPILTVQGCDLLVPHVMAVAGAVARWRAANPRGEVVIVETGRCRGDGLFAAALEEAVRPSAFWRLPDTVTVEDLAAVVAAGDLFVGSSLHGAITALVYCRPFVLLNLFGEAKLDGFADVTGLGRYVVGSSDAVPGALDAAMAGGAADAALLAVLQSRVDAHFDRLADMAHRQAAQRRRRRWRLRR